MTNELEQFWKSGSGLTEVKSLHLPVGLRKLTKTSVGIADIPTQIRTQQLPNISL
jgi:hypothetical protein